MISLGTTRTDVPSDPENLPNDDKNGFDYPIIVHCHFRWDGVWQRPQQFLSRLSKRHRILFIDGPTLTDASDLPASKLSPVQEHPNVTVMQTLFPSSRFKDGEWVDQ